MTAFDELTHFTQSQFLYLIGRLRSASEGDSFCMATTNPDLNSWVLNWVRWYLNEEGYPDPDKNGKIRYFLNVDDEPVFADTKEELMEAYPELCYQTNPLTGEVVEVPPMTYSCILGTIFDNPALIKSNPKYLAALKAQSPVNRARLLDGSWFAQAEGSNYFQREWLHKVDKIPLNCKEVRAWDLASSEPSDKYRYPDYTASVKMLKSKEGQYYIVGNYDPQTQDEKTKVYGKFRKRPGDRDRLILQQAKIDGVDTTVVIPKDPGAGGEAAFREMNKMFIQEGFICRPDPTPSNKSKLKRFEPFSSACQNGMVSIVESSFPNKETLNAFYKELEVFDGERSSADRKDDVADAVASAFNFLAASKVHTALVMPDYSCPTKLTNF